MTGLGTPTPWMLAAKLQTATSVLDQSIKRTMPFTMLFTMVLRQAEGLSYLVDDAIRSLTYLLDLLILHAGAYIRHQNG